MTFELYPYQREAVDALHAKVEAGEHPVLELATGLGKTVTMGGLAKRIRPNGRILFVAHREELLDQAARTFGRFGFSTGIEQGPRTVEPLFLPDIVIASKDTFRERHKRYDPRSFAAIFVDECHHAPALTYRAILDYFTCPRVGFTATIERLDGKEVTEVFPAGVVYSKTLEAGIREGLLCPMLVKKVALDAFSIADVGTGSSGDFKEEELAQAFAKAGGAMQVANGIAQLNEGRLTIAFLPSVLDAEACAGALRGLGRTAEVIHGALAKDKRRELIDRFRSGEIETLTCVDVLSEGFDVPIVSCVAMASPTRSQGRYLQRIGRGSRKADWKEDCLILHFATSDEEDPAFEVMRPKLPDPDDVLPEETPMAPREPSSRESFDATSLERMRVAASFKSNLVPFSGLVSFVKRPKRKIDDIMRTAQEKREEKEKTKQAKATLRLTVDWAPVPASVLRPWKEHDYNRSLTTFGRITGLGAAPYEPDEPSFFRNSHLWGFDFVKGVEIKRRAVRLCSLSDAWKLWRFRLPPNVSKGHARMFVKHLDQFRKLKPSDRDRFLEIFSNVAPT